VLCCNVFIFLLYSLFKVCRVIKKLETRVLNKQITFYIHKTPLSTSGKTTQFLTHSNIIKVLILGSFLVFYVQLPYKLYTPRSVKQTDGKCVKNNY